MLGKTILTEAEQDVSHDIMKELSYNIEGTRFRKRETFIYGNAIGELVAAFDKF